MKNERVILIKGDKSKWYDQIIFILKNKPETKPPVDLVKEAEKIVGNYLNLQNLQKNKITPLVGSNNKPVINIAPGYKPKKVSKNSTLDYILNIGLIVGCVSLAFLMLKLLS